MQVSPFIRMLETNNRVPHESRTNNLVVSRAGLILSTLILYLIAVSPLSGQLFYTSATIIEGSAQISIDNGGRFYGVDFREPIVYPRWLPNLIINDGGIWITGRTTHSDRVLILKSFMSTDFIPGRLEDGDQFVESHPERERYYARHSIVEGEEVLSARFHDGDTRFYRARAADVRSLGYPMRINIAVKLVSLQDRHCEDCILMRYTIRNMSSDHIDSLAISLVSDVTLAFYGPGLDDLDVDDVAEIVPVQSGRFVACYDVGVNADEYSMVGFGVVKTPSVESYAYHSRLWNIHYARSNYDESPDVELMYRSTDSLVSRPEDIIVFATAYLGRLPFEDSVTVTFAIIPARPGGTRGERIEKMKRRYEYLTLRTTVADENAAPQRLSSETALVMYRGQPLRPSSNSASIRCVDVTGSAYLLPVVGGSVDTGSLPIGMYVVVDEVGTVVQRICLIE